MSGKLKVGVPDPTRWSHHHLSQGGADTDPPKPSPLGRKFGLFCDISPMQDIGWGSNPDLGCRGPSPAGFPVSPSEPMREGGLFFFDLGWVVHVMHLFLFFLQALANCLLPCEYRTHHSGGVMISPNWKGIVVTNLTLPLRAQGAKSPTQGFNGRP